MSLSICEKVFIRKAIAEGTRLDGRGFNECRQLNIRFGFDWGSVFVSLGATKVLAQVSCEVTQPKQTRPSEGILFINVELGPIVGPNYESGKQSDLSVQLNRLLEKSIKDSRCVDLESLCIVAEEKVWALRVDIRVLNHAGNLIECASIAAIAALVHFKRPDVTKDGEKVVIHSLSERDPIPTVVHHHPICMEYGIFDNETVVADPTFVEEQVCNVDGDTGAIFIVGMNQYEELCLLSLMGSAPATPGLILKVMNKSKERCKKQVELIKTALIEDEKKRQSKTSKGFTEMISTDHRLALKQKDLYISLNKHIIDMKQDIDMNDDSSINVKMEFEDGNSDTEKVVSIGKGTAALMTMNVKSETESPWLEVETDPEEDV